MSVRRKHETLPLRLKLKRRYPIEEINIEARKNRRFMFMNISLKSLFLRARLSNDNLIQDQ